MLGDILDAIKSELEKDSVGYSNVIIGNEAKRLNLETYMVLQVNRVPLATLDRTPDAIVDFIYHIKDKGDLENDEIREAYNSFTPDHKMNLGRLFTDSRTRVKVPNATILVGDTERLEPANGYNIYRTRSRIVLPAR